MKEPHYSHECKPEKTSKGYLYWQGKSLTYKEVYNWRESPGTEKRGQITQFTYSSRLRLLKFFAKVDWSKIGKSLLISLTYPDARADRTYQERTQDRYLFLRKVERHLGRKVAAVWRAEFVKRRSGEYQEILIPHIHILMFNVTWIPWPIVRSWWRDILAYSGPLCTDVRRAVTSEIIASYICKYVAKVESTYSLDYAAYLNNPGRHWSIVRKGLIPLHHREKSQQLTEREIDLLRVIASQILEFYDVRKGGSFTLLGNGVDDLGRFFHQLGLVKPIEPCVESLDQGRASWGT